MNCYIDVQWPKYRPNGTFRTFYDDSVRLGLPDSTEIGPTVSQGLTLSDAAIHPNQYFAFQIKAGEKGQYVLRLLYPPNGVTRGPATMREIPLPISG